LRNSFKTEGILYLKSVTLDPKQAAEAEKRMSR